MAPHSSTLAWKIPWMEEPGRLQSMGSLRIGHNERLHFHFSLSCIGEGNGNPLQYSCLENPRDGGAWWVAVYGVAQSQTQLKLLSSSSSSRIKIKPNYVLEPISRSICHLPTSEVCKMQNILTLLLEDDHLVKKAHISVIPAHLTRFCNSLSLRLNRKVRLHMHVCACVWAWVSKRAHHPTLH